MKYYFLLFSICFFVIQIFAEDVYQGKIIGEDKSEFNNINIKDEIKKEEIKEKEVEIKREIKEKIPVEKIIKTTPEKKEDVSIKEKAELELQKKEIEKNIEKTPQKPQKFKIILMSIMGFLLILALAS